MNGRSKILQSMTRKIGTDRAGSFMPGRLPAGDPPAGDPSPGDGVAPPGGPPGSAGPSGNIQHAFDQATEALQVIASQYPEAGDLLKQLEDKWAQWMGGHSGDAQATKGGPPLPPPAPGRRVGAIDEAPPDAPPDDGGAPPA